MFQRDSNPKPPRYRCDSYEATHWERVSLLSLFLSWGIKWCEVYMKQFIFELRLWMKVKCDHRSKFSNLSNWKEEAWKNQGFNGIRTSAIPVRCSTNWAMKPHIGSEVNLLSSYPPWGVKWCEVYMKQFIFELRL